MGIILIGMMLPVLCCTSDRPDARKSPQRGQNPGLINVVKREKLVNFQQMTIGNALDSYRYLSGKEWRTDQLKTGYLVVIFTGWQDSGAVDDKARTATKAERGLEITFVFNPDGSFYLSTIVALERDGGTLKRTQVLDTAAVLATIYGNKKLTF